MKKEPCREKIIEMYRKTRSGGNIAKELGITNYRVYKCLREAGFDIKPRKPEKHSLVKMRTMYESGMSTTQIASKLNMNRVSIWERLVKNGVKMRDRNEARMMSDKRVKIYPSDYSKVIQMYQDGMSSMQIADYFGLKAKDTILDILHKNNIKIRNMYQENNPSWKGGMTPIHTLIRNCEKYNNFRSDIMRERNYTCELSGDRGIKLNIHHKKPFANLIQEFVTKYGTDISDRNLFYKRVNDFHPFWNKANIVLITEELHKKIHS